MTAQSATTQFSKRRFLSAPVAVIGPTTPPTVEYIYSSVDLSTFRL